MSMTPWPRTLVPWRAILAAFTLTACGGGVLSPPVLAGPATRPGTRPVVWNDDADLVAASRSLVGWWPLAGHGYDLAGQRHFVVKDVDYRLIAGRLGMSIEAKEAQAVCGTGLAPDATVGAALHDYKDNFSYCIWVRTQEAHPAVEKANAGVAGYGSHRLAIFPDHGGDTGLEAGVGLSVGTNGVTLLEHAGNHAPTTLVCDTPLEGWAHIGLVYNNNRPRVFVNGKKVAEGEQSARSLFPSAILGNAAVQMGNFTGGQLGQYMVFNRALTDKQMAALYSASAGAGREKQPAHWTAAELDQSWIELSQDPATALVASCRLAAGSDLVAAFLAERLRDPRQAVAGPDIAALVAQLDADAFNDRESAARQLLAMGPAIIPKIQEALDKKPSPEVTIRLESLLAKLSTKGEILSREDQMRLRVLDVLCQINTPIARKAIEAMSGKPESEAAHRVLDALKGATAPSSQP